MDKIGAALPIGLTALATVFAGMSTGALQQAMFWKSQAAQDQSKATNQWTLAGFKRDRALAMQTAAAVLRANSGYAAPRFDVPPIKASPGDPEGEKAKAQEEAQKKALGWLTEAKGDRAGPPPVKLPDVDDEHIKGLGTAIAERHPEGEILRLAGKVNKDKIQQAIDDAEKANELIDKEWSPIIDLAASLVRAQAAFKADDPDKAQKAINAAAAQAAGFELEQRRYRAESRLNQGIASLYEVRVRVSSAESDRHRHKSQNFFLAMLAAQIGAVVASVAMGRKRGGALWVVAGIVGLVSLGMGAYVFLQ
jgi:hypothetical protein